MDGLCLRMDRSPIRFSLEIRQFILKEYKKDPSVLPWGGESGRMP
jgi:hypothetical protein